MRWKFYGNGARRPRAFSPRTEGLEPRTYLDGASRSLIVGAALVDRAVDGLGSGTGLRIQRRVGRPGFGLGSGSGGRFGRRVARPGFGSNPGDGSGDRFRNGSGSGFGSGDRFRNGSRSGLGSGSGDRFGSNSS